jgi:hypothetical protein
MAKFVFSKTFSERLRAFTAPRRDDVLKAVERVLVDPDHKNYRRPYLHPYRQEHPSDKTLTIFFAIPSKPPGRVFFVWVNDDRHPHDTHKNHGDDPCVKEFVRLRDANLLAQYSEDEHEGKFTIIPRASSPNFIKFEKYRASVYSNVAHDTATHYTMAITSMNHPNDLFDHHRIFIEKIREHFLSIKEPFEFRVLPGDTAFQALLQSNANPAHWNQTQDGGMEIWAIK